MQSVSRVDDDPPDMEDTGPPTRLCGYVCTVMWYLVGSIVLLVFYMHNGWLIVRDPSGMEFQRGLRDDCLKNITSNNITCTPWGTVNIPFPHPYDDIEDPPMLMHLSVAIAVFLILLQVLCLGFSIACCCNDNCEKIAKTWAKAIVHFLAFGGLLYVALFLFLFICLFFQSSTLQKIPYGADESFGLGFYGFVVGGFILYMTGTYCFYREEINAILAKRFPFLNQPHHPLPPDAPPVSMRSVNTA